MATALKYSSHEEWLKTRGHGIGGSDVGAILGVNKYRTPLDVYLEKVGQKEPADLSDNQAVYWGTVLEDLIAKEYAKRMGVKVRRRNAVFAHNDHDWALASLDRTVDGQQKVFEAKTAGQYMAGEWGTDGSDVVPESYLVQVAWYMMVMGYDSADLAVLIGGRDFRIFHFNRDRELEDLIFSRVSEFWHNNILAGVAPDPVNETDLAALYSADSGNTVSADDEIEHAAHRLKHHKENMKTLKKDADELAFDLKKYMGDASALVATDGAILATWKKAKDSKKTDWKAVADTLSALVSEDELSAAVESATKTIPGSRRFILK